MTRRMLGGFLAAAFLLAVPALFIAGTVRVFSNPCFFRQFPPPSCTAAQKAPGAGGWMLILAAVFLLVLALMAALRKQARR